MLLVQEEAARRLGRPVAVEELTSDGSAPSPPTMTFACATDGNHGRSVAQGAQLIGARAVIFVHAGVSDGRIEAIARFGAEIGASRAPTTTRSPRPPASRPSRAGPCSPTPPGRATSTSPAW